MPSGARSAAHSGQRSSAARPSSPCQPVDARHHQRIAGLHEVEQHLQLGLAVAADAAGVLGTITLRAVRWMPRSWSKVNTRA